MLTKPTLLISIVCLIMASHARAAEPTLKVSASVAAMAQVFEKIQGPFEQTVGVKIQLVQKDRNGTGSDVAFKDFDAGLAEVGAGGTHWAGWQQLLQDQHYKPKLDWAAYKTRVVARDLIRIYTYAGGPKSLSEEQVASLLSGKATNWNQVGGANQPVLFIRSTRMPATERFLENRLLKIRHETMSIQGAKLLAPDVTVEQYIKQIGQTPGAFGVAPDLQAENGANKPVVPEFGRPITLVWKGAPSENLQKLLKFLENEGQIYVGH